MTSKKLFIFLVVFFLCALVGATLFFLGPKFEQINSLKSQLNMTTDKFKNATHAKNDVKHVQKILKESEKKLESIKGHFIRRDELRSVTQKLKEQTKKFDLSFDEFTPIFTAYIENKFKGQVKALPFSISVSGNYFKIGKFLDSWQRLPFYMFSDEIYLLKRNRHGDVITANISGRLYAWAKEKQ